MGLEEGTTNPMRGFEDEGSRPGAYQVLWLN